MNQPSDKRATGQGPTAQAHVAARLSCTAYTVLAIKTLIAAGRLRQNQPIFVGPAYGPTHLSGDGFLTQAAHRVMRGVWVVHRKGDPRYDALLADGRRSILRDGTIIAALPSAATSALGRRICAEPIRAVTVLPSAYNKVNSFTEGHGERGVYGQIIQMGRAVCAHSTEGSSNFGARHRYRAPPSRVNPRYRASCQVLPGQTQSHPPLEPREGDCGRVPDVR